jgi:hypothetical protein
LEALTGKDTSFISIMQDSENREFAHDLTKLGNLLNNDKAFESELSAITEAANKSTFNTLNSSLTAKPPKARKQSKAAKNGIQSATNFNNLYFYGDK